MYNFFWSSFFLQWKSLLSFSRNGPKNTFWCLCSCARFAFMKNFFKRPISNYKTCLITDSKVWCGRTYCSSKKGGIRRGCFQPLASLAILYVVEEIGNPFLGIRQPENRSDCCLSVLTKQRNQFLTLGSVHSPLLCTDYKL